MLGVVLILVSTAAYNGSAVLLAAEARRQSGDSNLLLAVGRRFPGAFAVCLNLVGWGLEVAALSLIPLTQARILNVAGLAILLGGTRWALKEPLGRREVVGVVLVALGTVAVSYAPPHVGTSSPGFAQWALLCAVLLPGILLPCVPRLLGRPMGSALGAVAAGLAYALSGVLNKGFADAARTAGVAALLTLVACIAAVGLWGFAVELDALKRGRASAVVPTVLALHTVVPILCAPLLFGEAWPAGPLPRLLLGGGISLALVGAFALSGSPDREPAEG